MNTLGNRGSIEEVEREKLLLEAQKKSNELLDLEIEKKKVELEMLKTHFEHSKRG